MNKKIKTYLLLVTAIGVWGLIAYKLLSTLNPEIPENTLNEITVKFNPKTSKVIDTFSIKVSKRDPFLGTLITKKRVPSISKRISKQVVKKDKIAKITYGGLIKKQQSKSQVFVININSNQYLLKKGQTIDSLKLVRGNDKEVVVKYKNRSLVIPIE